MSKVYFLSTAFCNNFRHHCDPFLYIDTFRTVKDLFKSFQLYLFTIFEQQLIKFYDCTFLINDCPLLIHNFSIYPFEHFIVFSSNSPDFTTIIRDRQFRQCKLAESLVYNQFQLLPTLYSPIYINCSFITAICCCCDIGMGQVRAFDRRPRVQARFCLKPVETCRVDWTLSAATESLGVYCCRRGV